MDEKQQVDDALEYRNPDTGIGPDPTQTEPWVPQNRQQRRHDEAKSRGKGTKSKFRVSANQTRVEKAR